MNRTKKRIDPNAPQTIRPATKDDLQMLVVGKLHDQFEVTLTVRFPGVPTALAYNGKVMRYPGTRGIAGLKFVPYDTVAYSAPPEEPTLTFDLNLEYVEKFEVKEYRFSSSLCWGSEAASMELWITSEHDIDG